MSDHDDNEPRQDDGEHLAMLATLVEAIYLPPDDVRELTA